MGCEDDVVIDEAAVQELAQYYGCKPVMLPRLAHDCMLVRAHDHKIYLQPCLYRSTPECPACEMYLCCSP